MAGCDGSSTHRWSYTSSTTPFVLLFGSLAVQLGLNPILGIVGIVVLTFFCSGHAYELAAASPSSRILLMGSTRQTSHLPKVNKRKAAFEL